MSGLTALPFADRLVLGMGKQIWLFPVGHLGRAHQARLIQQRNYVKKWIFWPFQLKSGHHRYGSYEHIVKALVIKTNQLSRRRRGPCTQ